ncbi:hypothetical protein [Serratia microhaemolytica]|uniref:hypothetical protein n=1 Tax=Serratia microhaemolytica TaxID=2675110 RepID=UPI001F0B757A|nr:hypothetical protein [Serratia microhaemolytica]
MISNTEYSYFALPENYNQLFTRLNPIIAARTASKTQNGYLNAADQVRKSALDRKATIGTLNANEQQQRANLVKKAAQQQQNLFTACEDETSAACLTEHKKLLQAQESYRGYAEYQTYYDLREQFPDEMAHYAELIGDYSHQLIGLLENGYTLEQAKAKLAQDQAESVEYARKYQEAVDKLPTWARIAMTIQDTVGMVYGAKAAGVGLGKLAENQLVPYRQMVTDVRAGSSSAPKRSGNVAVAEVDPLRLAASDANAVLMNNKTVLSKEQINRLPAEQRLKYIKNVVEQLNVKTPKNSAVFYSGRGARAEAELFAKNNGKMTLESTPGGKWLDNLKLFDKGVNGIEAEHAYPLWERLSQRYAQEASGTAVGILNNPRPASIFNTVEFPALKLNPEITNVITGGK